MNAKVLKLLNGLRSDDDAVRTETRVFLTVSKGHAAQLALATALQDVDPDIRTWAADILVERGGRNACRLLHRALQSDSYGMVRTVAADALGVFHYRKAIPTLIDALKDKEELVRVCAAESLGRMKVTASIPGLLALLDDRSPLVRGYAVASLGEIGKRRLSGTILARLKREHNTHTRLNYYYALYLLGNPVYLSKMVQLLRARHYRIRCAAANLLTASATPETISYLEQVLRHALDDEPARSVTSTIEHCLRDLAEMRDTQSSPV